MSTAAPERTPPCLGPALDPVREPGRDPVRVGRPRFAPAAAVPAVDAAALATAAVGTVGGWLAAGYALAVLLTLTAGGQHRPRIRLRLHDQLPRLAVAAALPLLVLWPWLPVAGDPRLVGASAGLLVAGRVATAAALRAAHRRGRLLEPVLLVGAGELGVRLASSLAEHPEFGLRPAGFLDTRPGLDGTPPLGRPDELADVVARLGVRRVLVCFPRIRDAELVPLLRSCRSLAAEVWIVPRLYELAPAVPTAYLDDVWGVPLLPLRRPGRRFARLVKRAVDLVAGAALLVTLGPVLLALAALVRLCCGRGVLFRQTRVTEHGRSASVLKLRTVRACADPRERDTTWSVPPDGCTRLGRWLRATHLDELPQLVNVLRGEMSLVGPRPERPYFARLFTDSIPHYDDRHRLPGGMTGWAQVHGLHGDTSISDRALFDNQYVEFWSPWLDAVILARTPAVAVRAIFARGGNR